MYTLIQGKCDVFTTAMAPSELAIINSVGTGCVPNSVGTGCVPNSVGTGCVPAHLCTCACTSEVSRPHPSP